MKFVKNVPLASTVEESTTKYDAPSNLSYFWSFGVFATFTLGIQFISGIFLSFHYIPEINFAFTSIEEIMRDVPGGVFFRFIHSNGASFFFYLCLFSHVSLFNLRIIYIS